MFKPLRLFLRLWFYLLLTTVFGKLFFAGYFYPQFSNLGILEILHSSFWGIRYDLSISALIALAIYTCAWLLHRLTSIRMTAISFILVVIAVFFAIMIHGSDTLYYAESGRHMGYELTEGINSASSLLTQLFSSHLWFLLTHLFWFVLMVTLIHLSWRSRKTVRTLFDTREFQISNQLELNLFAAILIAIITIRGGIQNLPLEPIHAQEIGSSQKATLALNGLYNAIYSTISGDQIKPLVDIDVTEDEINQFRETISHKPSNSTAFSEPLPNIVIVFLESWSAAYMQSYGGEDKTTPFFDQLRSKSITTNIMYAGGHRTTEGMFTSLCSWQNPLGNTISQNQLQNYGYYCLPHVLAEHGYDSIFIQGTNANTSGTGAFAKMLGFNESIGKREYKNELMPPNSWGYHDVDIYHQALKRLDSISSPALIGINTNSTHDVEMPEGIEAKFGIKPPIQLYKSLLHFSDTALRGFIDAINKRIEARDTLVILVADHAGPGKETTSSNYMIPFLIYSKKGIPNHPVVDIASQRDISPTLLDLIGIKANVSFSGKSLLLSGERDSDYYHQGVLGWHYNNRLLEIPITHPDKPECFKTETLKPWINDKQLCSKEDLKTSMKAFTFTRVSQSYLFNGKLKKPTHNGH